ncbi:MAG: site-specific integrase, partial [Loktanella sp.]|nr:site-specific integrase [Loktanella sp.]
VTARKAMNRLSIVMRHAAALGLDVDLQATDKAVALLGKQRHTAKNVPAMNWRDVPDFYQSLGGSVTELALRLLILTAVRSGPLRMMHVDQIDGDIWTIPAEAMKGRLGATSDFRVPLSTEAQAVVAEARKIARDGFLFPGNKRGVISDMTMTAYLDRRGLTERPHGFRSSFRDWTAEATQTPHDVAETCLGHTIGGTVERAYRRTDFLEQRRALMNRWADLLNRRSQIVKMEAI